MSDLLDAICNVHHEDRQQLRAQLDVLIGELTTELAVASAVRDALPQTNGQACEKPAATRTARRVTAQPGGVTPTTRTIEVARYILAHKAMTRDELAAGLGWPVRAVGQVLGRSKAHFVFREDGKILVASALADQVEG